MVTRIATIILFIYGLSSCLGIKKPKLSILSDIIAQDLNSIIQLPGTPSLVAFNPPQAIVGHPQSDIAPINPDPDRVDSRFLLSSEELQYIAQYESQLEESGFLNSESLLNTQKEMQETLEFQIPTEDDLAMYVDELELGIPHKPRVLTQEEYIAQERKIHEMIETVFLKVLAELENRTNAELKTMLLNISANLRLNQILLDRTSSTRLSKLTLEKNLEMTAYLRRRLIQVMIQKGIR